MYKCHKIYTKKGRTWSSTLTLTYVEAIPSSLITRIIKTLDLNELNVIQYKIPTYPHFLFSSFLNVCTRPKSQVLIDEDREQIALWLKVRSD